MSKSKEKIIFSVPKKSLDKTQQTSDNSSVTGTKEDLMKTVQKESTFNSDAVAYTHVYNPERKKYDILLIRIDTSTDKAVIEREHLRHDSELRARMEVQKRLAEDYINQQKKK